MPINFRFNIKVRLIVSGVLFALGIFIILQISLFQTQDISSAQAAFLTHKVRGWGWSENINWISMNCYNDFDHDGDFENCCPGGNSEDCPYGLAKGDYGVHYNTTNGKLTGYAWSDGVGWICFGETCQTVCLGGSNNGVACTTDDNCPDGGKCGGKPPHGLPVSWACVGRPAWTCQGGINDGDSCFKTSTDCPGGLCRFGCSDDAGEDFVDSNVCVRSSHLKSHWTMNNLSEGTIVDDSVNSNTGTLMPVSTPPIQAQGKFSDALQFDGTEDYIEVLDSASLSVIGNLTIEAWIKRGLIGDGLTGEQTIVGKWNESTGIKSYRLWFDVDNRLNFAISDGTTIATITQKDGICLGLDAEVTQCTSNSDCATGEICKNVPITDTNKWYHVVGKYVAQTSLNNPNLQLFINGSKIPTYDVVGTIPNTLTNQSENLYIGAKKGATAIDTYFNGIIDNVSIWSCQNDARIHGRKKEEIWDDAKIELDGWARVINLGEKGWLKLKGFTKDERVWGSFLNNYTTFYTFNGYLANRYVDESMPTNGLVAHWKMNEPNWDSNIPVNDSSGNANNGIAYGANVTKKGIFNSAGDFDGVDDYVSVSSNSVFDTAEEKVFTYSAWINSDNYNSKQVIIARSYPCSNPGHFTIYVEDNRVKFSFYSDLDSAAATHYSDQILTNGVTYHIVWVKKWGQTGVKLYVNGISQDIYGDSNLRGSTPSVPIYIGAMNGNWGGSCESSPYPYYFFNGYIDNVAIYNRILTLTEIQAAYNKSIPGCVGWEDYEHDYADPPIPLPFNSLSVAHGDNCNQLLVYWTPSTWAESYTYSRCLGISESDCSDCSYTERNVLAGSCTESDCSLTDIGLDSNTGYCYNITAHNETGSRWATDTPPTYPAPYWRSTTLCSPEGLGSDADTCGQVTLSWNKGTEDVDGYNIYRSLVESGSSSCVSLTSSGCELTGHLAEALDYNAENGPTNDLIAQWKMNEAGWIGTTGEVADSSTQTPLNNGTAVDADILNGDGDTPPITVAGIFDQAGDFDGVDDYVDISDISATEDTDKLTIAAWIYSNPSTEYRTVISKGYNTSGSWEMRMTRDIEGPNLNFSVVTAGGKVSSTITGYENSAWHYVVGVYDGVKVYIYQDGVFVDSNNQTGNIVDTDCTVKIGQNGKDLTPYEYWNGKIDNVSIYNVAKSAAQIKIDYEAGTNPNCDSGQCGLAYVCDDATSTDKCGANNTCCYTDSRIIPYINYYYRITATGETGETPSAKIIDGPAQTICFPALEEEEE